MPSAAARRLTSLRDQLLDLNPANVASAAPQAEGAVPISAAKQQFRLTDADVAAFVADGFVVLPNLVEAGDIDPSVCERIFELGYNQRDKPGMGPSRTELFEELSPHMNKVMASPTLRGGLESLLGPGYFMPPWNTHLHINGTGDGGFHADGTDHGPTQTTVRDHRPRQIFGFFYPGDVPLASGPTAVIPGSHYPAVDRIDPTTHLHVTNSEDGLPQELPEHLQVQHVLSSEDRLHADVPSKQRGPFSNASAETDEEAALVAADEQRLAVAAAMLGVEKVEEVKLTCKAGAVMLVHHDLFHRGSRRLPDVWRPLFVLRDAVRMVEPVAGNSTTNPPLPVTYRPFSDGSVITGAPSWTTRDGPAPPAEPPVDVARMNAHAARSPEVQALHRT